MGLIEIVQYEKLGKIEGKKNSGKHYELTLKL